MPIMKITSHAFLLGAGAVVLAITSGCRERTDTTRSPLPESTPADAVAVTPPATVSAPAATVLPATMLPDDALTPSAFEAALEDFPPPVVIDLRGTQNPMPAAMALSADELRRREALKSMPLILVDTGFDPKAMPSLADALRQEGFTSVRWLHGGAPALALHLGARLDEHFQSWEDALALPASAFVRTEQSPLLALWPSTGEATPDGLPGRVTQWQPGATDAASALERLLALAADSKAPVVFCAGSSAVTPQVTAWLQADPARRAYAVEGGEAAVRQALTLATYVNNPSARMIGRSSSSSCPPPFMGN